MLGVTRVSPRLKLGGRGSGVVAGHVAAPCRGCSRCSPFDAYVHMGNGRPGFLPLLGSRSITQTVADPCVHARTRGQALIELIPLGRPAPRSALQGDTQRLHTVQAKEGASLWSTDIGGCRNNCVLSTHLALLRRDECWPLVLRPPAALQPRPVARSPAEAPHRLAQLAR